MAKKKAQQRRVPHAADPRMFGDGKPSQAKSETAEQPAARVASPVARTTTARPPIRAAARNGSTPGRAAVTGVTVDYHYVLKDLRRLGLLAVAFFGVLVVLGLIIR